MAEQQRLGGRVALISGGARGIGGATARLFVEHGAQVVIGDLLEDEGVALAAELGGAAVFTPLDVRSEASWGKAVQVANDSFGPPTVLHANAGVMVVGPLTMATADDFRRAMEVNLIGAALGIQAVVEPMTAAGGGSIIIMSSTAGLDGTPGLPAYAASKAANVSLTKTVALELSGLGIRVNAIAPGGIDTAMSNSPEFDEMDKDGWYGKLPIPRIGEVEEIARTVLFLASDESSYMTGSVLVVDGGQLAGRAAF